MEVANLRVTEAARVGAIKDARVPAAMRVRALVPSSAGGSEFRVMSMGTYTDGSYAPMLDLRKDGSDCER